MSSLLFQVFEN